MKMTIVGLMTRGLPGILTLFAEKVDGITQKAAPGQLSTKAAGG
jgi:hypothetical protein